MGMVAVASLAARAPGSVPGAAMTLTLRRTRSAASSGSRSSCPSAQRYSMATLRPSTKPVSARPSRKASTRAVAGTAGRHGAEEADHWQRWLLRTRRERPRGCAAKRVDKFSSPDTDCHATLQRVMQRRERYHTRTCCAAGIRSGLCLLWVQKRESALFSLVSASTGCGYAAA